MVWYSKKWGGTTLTVIISGLWKYELLFCFLYDEHASLSKSHPDTWGWIIIGKTVWQTG